MYLLIVNWRGTKIKLWLTKAQKGCFLVVNMETLHFLSYRLGNWNGVFIFIQPPLKDKAVTLGYNVII